MIHSFRRRFCEKRHGRYVWWRITKRESPISNTHRLLALTIRSNLLEYSLTNSGVVVEDQPSTFSPRPFQIEDRFDNWRPKSKKQWRSVRSYHHTLLFSGHCKWFPAFEQCHNEQSNEIQQQQCVSHLVALHLHDRFPFSDWSRRTCQKTWHTRR